MKFIFFLVSILLFTNAGHALNSCATINPLYGILSNLTKGVSNSKLILDRPYDLHSYALTPADALKIKECDIVFIINEDFESFSHKLDNLTKKNVEIIEMSNAINLKLLELRENNIFEEEEGYHDHEHHGDYDLHMWLDINNAQSMASMIKYHLVKLDPSNKEKYEKNFVVFVKKLNKLDREVVKKLEKVKNNPYFVFHDGYQYFENRYGLKPLGAISINTQYTPGPKTLSEIKELVVKNQVKCIFKEPQVSSKIADVIASSSGIKVGSLDAEWAEGKNPEDIYFNLLTNIADNFVDCFK